MSISIYESSVTFTKTTFPGGESCIRVNVPNPFCYERDLTLELDFESNGDLFDLALLVDAIRREYLNARELPPRLKLFMPYVPYARQDRVCNPGESLSIKVVADFINSLGFTAVLVMDPHSDVTSALFNNIIVEPQETCAPAMVEQEDGKFVLYDRQTQEQETQGLLQPVFVDGKLIRTTTFAEVVERLRT